MVCLVLFAAKLTTIHGNTETGFLFYVPDWVQTVFLETGLVACVLVVILAQLMPQGSFTFLSNWGELYVNIQKTKEDSKLHGNITFESTCYKLIFNFGF